MTVSVNDTKNACEYEQKQMHAIVIRLKTINKARVSILCRQHGTERKHIDRAKVLRLKGIFVECVRSDINCSSILLD